MNSKKLVSVIIPTYNRCDLIKETIDSVLNQTHQNFEILVVDDGSTDNTRELLNSYKDERIKYIYVKHKGLPAYTRNIGLKMAKGDFIAFLDSDDLWKPIKLEKQLNRFINNKGLLLVSSKSELIPKRSTSHIDKNLKDQFINFYDLLMRNDIINSSVLLKKEVYNLIRELDENPSLKGLEDFDYWLRLAYYQKNSILILKDSLVKYRIHNTNISKKHSEVNQLFHKYNGLKIIFKKHEKIAQNKIRKIFNERIYPIRFMLLYNLLLINRIDLNYILKDNHLKIIDKLRILRNYFYLRYLKNFIEKFKLFSNFKQNFMK